jgi:hypothetical protein
MGTQAKGSVNTARWALMLLLASCVAPQDYVGLPDREFHRIAFANKIFLVNDRVSEYWQEYRSSFELTQIAPGSYSIMEPKNTRSFLGNMGEILFGHDNFGALENSKTFRSTKFRNNQETYKAICDGKKRRGP